MSMIVFAVTRDTGSSPPLGLVQPQYLPALAQSRLLQLRCAQSESESSVRPIRSWLRKAMMLPLPRSR